VAQDLIELLAALWIFDLTGSDPCAPFSFP